MLSVQVGWGFSFLREINEVTGNFWGKRRRPVWRGSRQPHEKNPNPIAAAQQIYNIIISGIYIIFC